MSRRAACRGAAVGLLALLMAGTVAGPVAAQDGSGVPSPVASPAASPGASLPAPTPFPDAVATVAPLPAGAITDAQVTPWDHVTIWPDGRTLSVAFTMGPQQCDGLQKVDLGRTHGALRITLHTGERADAAGLDCSGGPQLYDTIVTLSKPILGGGHATLTGVQIGEPMGDLAVAGAVLMEDEPEPWDRVQVAADGQMLQVAFLGGSAECYGLSRVDTPVDGDLQLAVVHYGPLANPQSGQTVCSGVGVPYHALVTLAAPLLLGGATPAAESPAP
ncbi:MAG: hypothetical protein U0869_14455 [Chloroflexota bacterium]